MTILDNIIADKRQEVDRDKTQTPTSQLINHIKETEITKERFTPMLQKQNPFFIAEFKRKSPSAGDFPKIDIHTRLQQYKDNGAQAFSILTDQNYFAGSNKDISTALQFNLPILRKEFIIDEWQIYQSKQMRVDCILLIARILSAKQLQEYHQLATELNLAVIVEIHNQTDINKLTKNMTTVGVNNRDLSTMTTSLNNSTQLAPLLSNHPHLISESGITTTQDIATLQTLGYQGFLIGASLLSTTNQANLLSQLQHASISH